jgi:hypothetical protein
VVLPLYKRLKISVFLFLIQADEWASPEYYRSKFGKLLSPSSTENSLLFIAQGNRVFHGEAIPQQQGPADLRRDPN